jgi:hypothetical protein
MGFKMSYIGIIALIGAVLAIASVFLNWIVIDGTSGGITGWEIFDDIGDFNDMYFLPVIVLVLAVVAALLAVLEFVGKGSMITRIIMLILGILIIVLSYLTYSDVVGDSPILEMGYGLYFEFAAAVALIIAPVLCFAGVLDE